MQVRCLQVSEKVKDRKFKYLYFEYMDILKYRPSVQWCLFYNQLIENVIYDNCRTFACHVMQRFSDIFPNQIFTPFHTRNKIFSLRLGRKSQSSVVNNHSMLIILYMKLYMTLIEIVRTLFWNNDSAKRNKAFEDDGVCIRTSFAEDSASLQCPDRSWHQPSSRRNWDWTVKSPGILEIGAI